MWQSLENLNIYNFNFETSFVKNENLWKTGVICFSWKYYYWKYYYFHTKMPCQKPMLRQIEQGEENEPLTKNGVLPLTTNAWKVSKYGVISRP